jgi:uncharacterized DUF497 family protein
VKIEFDPAKNEWNIRERGLSLEDVIHLDWSNAILMTDQRKDYAESRTRALLRDKSGLLYQVTFTMRGNVMRVISFRRAHEKERKYYD